MKRPRQHIIETISKKAFEKIIPDEWVPRELTPDYGIDYQVEIFSEGEATGKSFFVQLKGTDSSPKEGKITYYLENKTIEYYSKTITPILFVLYSVPEKKFWAIWINNFKNTTSFKSDSDKSPIVFQERNLIDSTYFKEIGKKIDKDFFSSPSISFKTDGLDESDRLSNIIQRWIKALWGEFVVINEPHIHHQILFTITSSANGFTITVRDSTLGEFEVPSIPFNEHCEYLWFPNIGEELVHTELDDIFVLFSLFTLNNFHEKHFKILTTLLKRYEGELLSIENIFKITQQYLTKKEYDLLQSLITCLIENKKFDLFQFFQFPILPQTAKDDRAKKIYVESLRLAIKEINDEGVKGTFCYNLANALRSYGNEREAIKHYFLARKYEPSYTERPYWYFELGGMFFLTKHYRCSAAFYKKSLYINEKYFGDFGYALLGDACYMARNFKGAKKYLNIYLDKTEKPYSEYVLKELVVSSLKENGFDFENFELDQSKASEITGAINFDADKQIIIDQLDEALGYDPLCPHARFNYGVTLGEQGDNANAFYHFLVCALTAEWDISAWVHAFMLSLNLENELISPYILDTFMKKHGSKALEEIRNFILKQKNPIDEKRQIFAALEQAVNFIKENNGIHKECQPNV
jgi:tetratricopeptide (TPR) repeat protein